MTVKRYLVDFLCAFAVFAIVLLSIAALTGEGFFEDAVGWNEKEGILSLFGTEISFDKRLPDVLRKLLSFNDVIFVKGTSDAIAAVSEFFAQYASDTFMLAYRAARMAVGAE